MNLIDFLASPWAIVPDRLHEMQAIYAAHFRGEKLDIEAIEARLGRPLANEQQDYTLRDGGIAVLPIEGVISAKANMMTRVSGGTSAQMLVQQVNSMRDDPRVRGAVLAFDTPGGSVYGIPELGAAIRALAAGKPTVSVSTGMMASAGYWIGSAANAVYLSGETDSMGSIGVVATHTYDPRRQGTGQTTEVTAGKFKRIASDAAPLTSEGRAYMQQQVDELYRVFVMAVAENRKASVDQVLENMADGRLFIGHQAIAAGLADGIASVDTLVERMATDPTKFVNRRKASFALGGLPTTVAGAAAVVDLPAIPPTDVPVSLVESITIPHEVEHMTPQEIAAKFAAENPEALALVRAEGAAAEQLRVQAVRAQSLPGHEKLIDALAADGKTSGPEAAAAVIAAERGKVAAAVAARAADAPAPVATVPGDAPASSNTKTTHRAGEQTFSVNAKRAKLHADALAWQAAHKGTDYLTAVQAVENLEG